MRIFLDYIFQFLGLTIGILSLPKIKLQYSLIFIHLGMSLLTDFYAEWYGRLTGSNYEIYNVYMILEVLLLGGSAMLYFKKRTWNNRLNIIMLFYLIFALCSFYWNSIYVFNTYLLIIGFILIGSINMFIIIEPNGEKSIFKNPMILISIAHIVYFCAVTPLFICREYLLHNNLQLTDELFDIVNRNIVIIRYFLISVAFIIIFYELKFNKKYISQ